MPGFSAAQIGDGDRDVFSRVHGASESAHQTEEEYIEQTTLARSTYPEYPLRVIESDRYIVGFEGCIYDRSPTNDELLSLADSVFSVRGTVPNTISEWVGSVDGDFILLFANRDDGQLAVLNDAFARLPIYYQCTEQGLVISRSIGVVRDYSRLIGAEAEIDPLGVAQSLLFRYTLGDRTVFERVKRLSPGSLLRTTGDGVEVNSTYQFDFSNKPYAGKSVRENAEELAESFSTACEQRSGSTDCDIVALSGGLDSRGVAAAHHRNGTPFVSATHTGTSKGDVEVAEKVADALDSSWILCNVSDSDVNRRKIIERKRGMSPVQRGSGVEFQERLVDVYGPSITTFSGDGGDKALPDQRSPATLRTDRDLIEGCGKIDVEDVASITRCSQKKIIKSVRDRIDSYPEPNLSDKRAHFMLRERGINWLGENEDTNRYFHWHVAPFYSRPFFERAMACPHEQKSNQKLQREFLKALSPIAVSIRDENTGYQPGAIRFRATRQAKGFIRERPYLRALAISLLGRKDETKDADEKLERSELQIASVIRSQLNEQSEIDEALSVPAIRRALRSKYAETPLYNLLTATSLTVRDIRGPKEIVDAAGAD